VGQGHCKGRGQHAACDLIATKGKSKHGVAKQAVSKRQNKAVGYLLWWYLPALQGLVGLIGPDTSDPIRLFQHVLTKRALAASNSRTDIKRVCRSLTDMMRLCW
jgi:hypothetical protein